MLLRHFKWEQMIEQARLKRAEEIIVFLNFKSTKKILALFEKYPEGLSQVQAKNELGLADWNTVYKGFKRLLKYRLVKKEKTGKVKHGRYIYTLDDYHWSVLSHAIDKIYYLNVVK